MDRKENKSQLVFRIASTYIRNVPLEGYSNTGNEVIDEKYIFNNNKVVRRYEVMTLYLKRNKEEAGASMRQLPLYFI